MCSGLTYRFGTHTAVDHVDLRIERGRDLRSARPERRGQDHHNPDADDAARGRWTEAISVLGVDTADRPMLVRRMIGYVPQLLSADATLTGRENVELFARLFDVPRAVRRRDRVEGALAAMGLDRAWPAGWSRPIPAA